MTDYTTTQIEPMPGVPSSSLLATTLVVYGLFGFAALMGLFSAGFHLIWPLASLVGIIAVILAYAKRSDAEGTWLASHYRWLIRTFWFSFLWGVIGGLVLVTLGLILIGIPIAFLIWGVAAFWVIYRVLRGFLRFTERKPLPVA